MEHHAPPPASAAISIRVAHVSRSKYDGQRRHDLRIGQAPDYVDQDRTHLNRVLIEPPRPAVMRARADELRALTGPQRKARSSAAVATTGIIAFGAAAQTLFQQLTPEQQDAAYLAVAERVAQEYDTSVRSLVVHGDETAPHAHVVWDCRSTEGVLMSKVMKGSKLQDIAAEVIAEHAPGIVRGVRKSARIARGEPAAAIYNRSVRQLHADLPAEIAAARARVDEMEGRVIQLEARKAELTERELKRLATYQKRRADRQRELDELERTRDEVSSDILQTGMALEEQRAEADRREAQLNERAADLDRREAAIDETVRAASEAAAKAVVGVITGDVRRTEGGGWQVRDAEVVRPIWRAIAPTVERLADWWQRLRPRVEALPDPERDDLLRGFE
ncbi:plasmid recombination protein [Limimaricola cinnabarinus]|uniref:Plasmid recombination enzyme n=1 Tax=Limimaricola cinnabarinus TaxID=1125964 RepID=A0A2G1MBW7_9RHOB|nr:plasmid recombination protein [Limimaricola cinnabarinus]PHP26229.1 hypothetical protein CJ301_17480 [Limimaricola cinnabarinus]